MHPLPVGEHRVPAGLLQVAAGGVLVGTGTRPVLLGTVQRPGRTAVPAQDWARGARPGADERFG